MIQLSASQHRELPGSIYASILSLAERGKPTGIAAEIDKDLRRKSVFSPGEGMVISLRALSTSVFSAGGALAGEQQGDVAAMLLPNSAALKAGVQVITGLTGDLNIPSQTSDTTFSWLHQLDSVTASDPAFGSANGTPHRCVGQTSITRQANVQSADVLGSFLARSLSRGLGSATDAALLSGTGVSGEPLGIFKTAGVNTVTFSGAATLAKCLDFQTQAANANADDTALTWIAAPAIRAKWRALQRHSGSSATLWSNDADTIGNRPAFVSTHCSATTGIVCGDFQHMALCIWGEDAPVQIIADPYTAAMQGRITFTASIMADVLCLRPTAFTRAADSAVA